MIKTIVIDDEIKSCEILEELLNMFDNGIQIVAKAHNITDAIHLIDTKKPNLVFLDIQMPTGTGFEILESIKYKNFNLVFVTAHDEYALKAFKYSATDYLLKPINIADLEACVKKIESKQPSDNLEEKINFLLDNYETLANGTPKKKIILPIDNKFQVFDITKLIRCNGLGNYTEFHFTDRPKIVTTKSLRNYEDLLLENGFFKIHRSHIINIQFIASYSKGLKPILILTNGDSIEISRDRKESFFELMGNL
jgi:two-component system LytT family response regulator